MVGTGVHLYKRNIPMSLKVIHARMVAQGGVIAALCGVGANSLYNEFSGEHKAGSASVRAMGMGGCTRHCVWLLEASRGREGFLLWANCLPPCELLTTILPIVRLLPALRL